MSRAIEEYLDRVMLYANRNEVDTASLRAELRDHMQEKVDALVAGGMPPEDAVFAAIKDMGSPRVVGYGLRPRFPWIDIRTRGTARGVIAMGPRAVGVVAFGGMAVGVVALGGLSVGVISMGGLALGLLFVWAGVALAPLGIAYGGVAVGLIALGGAAVGVVAYGGVAAGVWVPQAGAAASYHSIGEVPPMLVGAWRYWSSAGRAWALFCATMGIFAVLYAVGGILQRRENRRMQDGASVFAE